MSGDHDTTIRVAGKGAARLVVVTESTTLTLPIPERGRITLGRSREADVTIDDPSISRIHAALHIGDTVDFVDLGSSNGSWVRGEKAVPNEVVQIKPGELIEVGRAVVVVQGLVGQAGDASVQLTPPAGESPMDFVHSMAEKAALHRLNVLLLGETGVGKGVMARKIHDASPRAEGPFVVVDCAALSGQLLESELFGHEEGAFTGARKSKPGLLETAAGGTAFLDEVGELPETVQAKLLRAIEDKTVLRIGSVQPRTVDVRFVAATNRDLATEVAANRFRRDLYFRLNAFTLTIPPLRERRGEILPLAEKFATEIAAEAGRDCPTFNEEARRWLHQHAWPGNVRELRNTIERAVALSDSDTIDAAAVRAQAEQAVPASSTELSERDRIAAALEQCAGNQTKAAKLLGISRRTLIHRLDLYRLPRPRKAKS